jgi:hypothetical protein
MEMELLLLSLGVKEALEKKTRNIPVDCSRNIFGNRLATKRAATDKRRPTKGNHNLPSRFATSKDR